MIIVVLVSLMSVASYGAMPPSGKIIIPVNQYTNNPLDNYGTMAYQPIEINLGKCLAITKFCVLTLTDRSWWTTRLVDNKV